MFVKNIKMENFLKTNYNKKFLRFFWFTILFKKIYIKNNFLMFIFMLKQFNI